jgi:hypothetical protein
VRVEKGASWISLDPRRAAVRGMMVVGSRGRVDRGRHTSSVIQGESMNALRASCSALVLGAALAAQTPALATPYGAGCLGLTLTSTLPQFSIPWVLTTTGFAPGTLVLTGFSTAPTAVPLPSPPWDLGCTLLILPPITLFVVPAVAPPAVFPVAVPNTASLKGAELYVQSFGITPGPWSASNGIMATIGI